MARCHQGQHSTKEKQGDTKEDQQGLSHRSLDLDDITSRIQLDLTHLAGHEAAPQVIDISNRA
jgi:hypothetical protein